MFAYRKTGRVIEVLCSVADCGQSYVEIHHDRMLIFERHYNRNHEHMTVVSPEAMAARIFGTFCAVDPVPLPCDCGLLPCATGQQETLTFRPLHRIGKGRDARNERHENVWGIEEYGQVCRWLGLFDDTMPGDSTASSAKVA